VVPARLIRLDPLAVDYATTTAAAGTLLVFVIAALRAQRLRRLELGVTERTPAALAIALTALIVTVPAALLDVTAPDRCSRSAR
jgi:predicted membrane protein